VSLYRHDSQHWSDRWSGRAQQPPSAFDIVRDRGLTILSGTGDENVRSTGPSSTVSRYRQVELQGNGVVSVELDRRFGLSGQPSNIAEHPPVSLAEECLKVKLVLAKRRVVQLALDMRTELGVGERSCQPAGEPVHGRTFFGTLRHLL
jgi:hypothetical protein